MQVMFWILWYAAGIVANTRLLSYDSDITVPMIPLILVFSITGPVFAVFIGLMMIGPKFIFGKYANKVLVKKAE